MLHLLLQFHLRSIEYVLGTDQRNFYFDQEIELIVEYMNQIQSFILYHHKNGSTFNTRFWKEANKLYKKNKDSELEDIIKYVKNNDYDYIRNIHDYPNHFKPYAQWQPWNIKLWVDNV